LVATATPKPDFNKAATLIKHVRFVVVDGHHRFNALKELEQQKQANVPKLVCSAVL
jgi:hypothetical protein